MARLTTVQTALVDLYSRLPKPSTVEASRRGELLSLCQAIGLTQDPTTWTIPAWERQLRIRLYWAVRQYEST